MWPVIAGLLPLPGVLLASAPRVLDGMTLAYLLVSGTAMLYAQQRISLPEARGALRRAAIGCTGLAAALAAIHVAAAAYLTITNPLAGDWPLLVLDTFLPVLLGGAAVLGTLVLVAGLRTLSSRTDRALAWMNVLPRWREVPVGAAALLAVTIAAYSLQLGSRIALHLLFG